MFCNQNEQYENTKNKTKNEAKEQDERNDISTSLICVLFSA